MHQDLRIGQLCALVAAFGTPKGKRPPAPHDFVLTGPRPKTRAETPEEMALVASFSAAASAGLAAAQGGPLDSIPDWALGPEGRARRAAENAAKPN